MGVVKNMWLWANDGKIVEKFNGLKISEIIFFTLFVLLFSTKYFWRQLPVYFYSIPWGVTEQTSTLLPYLWTAVLAILLVSRSDVFLTAFSWSKVSHRVVLKIDKKVYFIFLLSVVLVFGVFLLFPDSWPETSKSIKNIASSATFASSVLSIIKEEVLYRLILYYSLQRIFGRNIAFFSTVVLFSLIHQANGFYYPFAVAPAGILFSVIAIASGSILASVLLHFIFNISIYIFVIYVL